MKNTLFTLLLSVAASMAQAKTDSMDIKIGQMIMVGIGELKSLPASDPLCAELASGKIGGVVLFEKNLAVANAGDSLRQLIKNLQRHSTQRLFVSIDEEGGKVHRLKEKYGFFNPPSAAYLGRLNNADSTLFHHRRLASLLSDLGFNLNYTPSVDLAVNPQNTVIVRAERSFGSSPQRVAEQAAFSVQAHHEHKVGTVLKHFPGHGSSAGDSHFGVTDVSDTWSEKELAPYDTLIRAGLCDAVMVAHLVNKHWDPEMLPATLSKKVVQGMVRERMGFIGVVFSDDLQMKAVADHYGLEKTIMLAVNAGLDILMFANTTPDAKDRITATQIHGIIRKLVENKTIPKSRIDESYRRIMAMKKRFVVG